MSSDLAGTWSETEAAEFERATEPFRQIDEKMWGFPLDTIPTLVVDRYEPME